MELGNVRPVIAVAPHVLRPVWVPSSIPKLDFQFKGCRHIFNRPLQDGPCVRATGLNDHAASRQLN